MVFSQGTVGTVCEKKHYNFYYGDTLAYSGVKGEQSRIIRFGLILNKFKDITFMIKKAFNLIIHETFHFDDSETAQNLLLIDNVKHQIQHFLVSTSFYFNGLNKYYNSQFTFCHCILSKVQNSSDRTETDSRRQYINEKSAL